MYMYSIDLQAWVMSWLESIDWLSLNLNCLLKHTTQTQHKKHMSIKHPYYCKNEFLKNSIRCIFLFSFISFFHWTSNYLPLFTLFLLPHLSITSLSSNILSTLYLLSILHTREVRFGSDWYQMREIWDFLT